MAREPFHCKLSRAAIYPDHTVPDPAHTPASAPATRDTIVAIATPPGRGGIGILRLSGPDARSLATPLLRTRGATTPLTLEPNRARFCEIVDPLPNARSIDARLAGNAEPDPGPDPDQLDLLTKAPKLDEAIATFFQQPNSYTGEDVLEIAAHGSPVLLDFLLRRLISLGARLANPGEFTERAFLAGRLDLTQAEAVRDLIAAQTLYQARIAASQLDGALSRRVAPIKQSLIHLIAQLEAGIDFAEDDTPTLSPPAILELTNLIAAQLATLAHSFEHGRLVHSGFTLAIVGEPNVGKSSLFNRLVERERAIVTATPGTTRDLVTERLSLSGIPIELVDTAGLRTAVDEAERLGIEKSREALAEADLVLLVLDASSLFTLPSSATHDPEHDPSRAAHYPAHDPAHDPEHDPEHDPSRLPTYPPTAASHPPRGTNPPSLFAAPPEHDKPSPLATTAHPEPSANSLSLFAAPPEHDKPSPLATTAHPEPSSNQPTHSPGSPSHRPSAPLDATAALLRQLEGRRAILVLNKCDLLGDTPQAAPADPSPTLAQPASPALPPGDLQQQLAHHLRLRLGHSPNLPTVTTSARTSQGLDTLRQAIHRQLQTPALDEQTGMLTNLRQHQSVAAALDALRAAALAAALPHEMLLLDLYAALAQLDSLTGDTTPDDILNLIFSTFCIGK